MLMSPAFGKGETVKLTIAQAGLPASLDTIDADAIAPNVWGGDFVDWESRPQAPVANLPRYTIQFHVKPPREAVRMMYVVYYVWDSDAGRALVYLPGPGEKWYSLNVSTILRDGSDGRDWRDGQWYYATAAWTHAIQDVVRKQIKVTGHPQIAALSSGARPLLPPP
jgi:hypothetical protein